ncbi:MAG: HD domain-containing protein [Candidatus Gastranaerophilales bacterium]|nr:HD domain-containing protein [Candidatus Gastranaerophilales bacterium]
MPDFNAEYEVMSFAVGDTKAGTKMGKLQLKNKTTDVILNCILWEEALNRMDSKIFKTGNTIKILSATYNERFNNCLINNLELLKEAKSGIDKEEAKKLYDFVIATIETFKNEDLKNFTKTTIEKNKEKFMTAPAAKVMHHNYLGGLLVHVSECIKFANAVYPCLFKEINKDTLLAACILHDIGKIFEYTIDPESGFVDYASDFQKDWISHSQYGFSLCMANNQPMVAKMIASHHGRADWGAMIDLNEKDLDNFYYIVHHIDDLSAKFGRTCVNDL